MPIKRVLLEEEIELVLLLNDAVYIIRLT